MFYRELNYPRFFFGLAISSGASSLQGCVC
jgi:hypothetical protein